MSPLHKHSGKPFRSLIQSPAQNRTHKTGHSVFLYCQAGLAAEVLPEYRQVFQVQHQLVFLPEHPLDNEHKNINVIVNEKILPLLDKKIILDKGYTKNNISCNMSNMWIAVNSDMIDVREEKIKYLKLERFK